ncbi:hypothetical protein Taro_043989 [Colocasia esculenta]|uniref:Retrotransposon gag domain-containing protein n=1 Tax=Colocasia esculenta TaxID=4460 RepID=A0A843WTF1_COLES|nr:hypothetical protein [Colocasia esculenta]
MDSTPMGELACSRNSGLCNACRSEKLASTSLDAGLSVGVHRVDADTTSTSTDIDANLAFGQNSKTCRNHEHLIPLYVVDAYRGYLSSWVPQFPTKPVTSEAHPYSPQVRARRRFIYLRPVRSRVVAVLAQRLQQCSFSFFGCTYCTSGLRPVRGRRTRVKYVIGLTGLNGAFHHSWYQSKVVVMADRRDWGGGGDDPEESTQRMIESIWESLTDIRARMDQQAPVPPVTREEVPVAPIPPQPGVEVPFVAPVLPPPPVIAAEEPVVQIERFLRLQPPTYTGGPNPDTAEHWIHEIERVFMTMRCPAVDRVVFATFQLRGFGQEWWRLKMQTTFAGRIEGAITWSKFLEVFNDTFFPLQVQQAKREQFRTLQQGETLVLEYQMRFMALSRTVEEAAQRAATLERAVWTRQVGESGSGSSRLPQQSAGVMVAVVFKWPSSVCMCATCSAQGSGRWEGDAQDCRDLIAAPRGVALRTAAVFLNNPSQAERRGFLLGQGEVLWRFQLGLGVFGVSSLQGVREKQGKRQEIAA